MVVSVTRECNSLALKFMQLWPQHRWHSSNPRRHYRNAIFGEAITLGFFLNKTKKKKNKLPIVPQHRIKVSVLKLLSSLFFSFSLLHSWYLFNFFHFLFPFSITQTHLNTCSSQISSPKLIFLQELFKDLLEGFLNPHNPQKKRHYWSSSSKGCHTIESSKLKFSLISRYLSNFLWLLFNISTNFASN